LAFSKLFLIRLSTHFENDLYFISNKLCLNEDLGFLPNEHFLTDIATFSKEKKIRFLQGLALSHEIFKNLQYEHCKIDFFNLLDSLFSGMLMYCLVSNCTCTSMVTYFCPLSSTFQPYLIEYKFSWLEYFLYNCIWGYGQSKMIPLISIATSSITLSRPDSRRHREAVYSTAQIKR
jgi:hypothetical protein